MHDKQGCCDSTDGPMSVWKRGQSGRRVRKGERRRGRTGRPGEEGWGKGGEEATLPAARRQSRRCMRARARESARERMHPCEHMLALASLPHGWCAPHYSGAPVWVPESRVRAYVQAAPSLSPSSSPFPPRVGDVR
eukprot:361723-Chlamydomonas_euryale.AAC.5